VGDYAPSYLTRTIKQYHFTEWKRLSQTLDVVGFPYLCLKCSKRTFSPWNRKSCIFCPLGQGRQWNGVIPDIVHQEWCKAVAALPFPWRELFLPILPQFCNTYVCSFYVLLSFIFWCFFQGVLEIPVSSPKKTTGSPFSPTPLILNRLQGSRKVAETESEMVFGWIETDVA